MTIHFRNGRYVVNINHGEVVAVSRKRKTAIKRALTHFKNQVQHEQH